MLSDADATVAFAAHLARALATVRGGVIHLRGDLGAGKTTLARGLLRAFGVQGAIRSPSYTLMEPYELGDRRALHLDLYRLQAEEIDQLGLDDYPPEETLWLVEWPERAAGLLPPPDLDLQLTVERQGRRLDWSASARWQEVGARLAADFT